MSTLLGTKPLHIYRGNISGRWYATNRWKQDGETNDGTPLYTCTGRKEDVTEQIEEIMRATARGEISRLRRDLEAAGVTDALPVLEARYQEIGDE